MKVISGIMAFLAAACVWLLVSAPEAEAAVVKIEHDEQGPYIMFVGAVEQGDNWKVLSAIQLNPGIKRIKMSSQGGVATMGYAVGDILAITQMHAIVPRGASCLSACATAFSGAATHEIHGALGYHVTWTTAHNTPAIQAMIAGQQFATMRAKYYLNKGFHFDLPFVIAMATTSSRFFVFTDTADFLSWKVGLGAHQMTSREYEEDYLVKHLVEGEQILEYVVSQRREDI